MIKHRFVLRGVLLSVAAMVAGLLFLETRAHSQVVGTTTSAFTIATTPTNLSGSFSIPHTLQDSAANALVVGTYIDNTHTLSNMLYAGVAPQTIVTDQRLNLFYFENPADTGDFTFDYTIDTDNSPNFAFVVLELLDVDLDSTVDTGVGATINTTVDNQFVVTMVGLNNDAGAALAPSAGSLLTVAGVADANGALGGGSVGAGFVDARASGAAGAKNVGWQGNGGGFFQGQASIALQAPPILADISLVVNKSTGEVKIRNDADVPLSIDYYALESIGNALDLAGWNSLADQGVGALPADFDGNGSVGASDLPIWQAAYGVSNGGDANGDGTTDGRDFLAWQRSFGSVPGVTNTWIEAGGSSTSRIGELLLDGATWINPGEEISLGMAYNKAVFGTNDGDLIFNLSLGDSTQLVEGAVFYEPNGLGAVAVIPEPSSIVISVLAGGLFMRRRR